MIRKNHDWTDADEALLSQAVMDLDPLREQYEERGIPTKEFWSAVAGRIAPQVVVTGKACRERWCTIEARRKAALGEGERDAWADVADRVEQYERELGEATYDAAAQTLRAVEFIRERVPDEIVGVNHRLDSIETMIANNADEQQLEALRQVVKSMEAKVDRLLAEWTGQTCAKDAP